MCGIAGIWHRDGRPIEDAVLRRMGDVLHHRGPDALGTHVDGAIGLVNRRLVIIDPTDGGSQPMMLPERGLALTYNGEVHNYLELRRELEKRGVSFRSSSDTEVVLEAYAALGLECFERFNGMWALAIWDAREQRLVLSRDRFGIKPLYYSVAAERVCFASEAKAILAAFPEERRPDGGEIFAFLNNRTPDVGTGTFFANVQMVPQSTCLVFTRDAMRRTGYWRFEPGDESSKPDLEGQFRELLADSVRLRMRSDVPVGVTLSGGLDSSAVAGLVEVPPAEAPHAFSLKYDDSPLDESRFAALAGAGRFRSHWVRPDPSDMVATIRRIVWHHDGPTSPRGRYALWFVTQEASRPREGLSQRRRRRRAPRRLSQFVLPYLSDRVRYGGRRGLVREAAGPDAADRPQPTVVRRAGSGRPIRRRLGLERPPLERVHSLGFAREFGPMRLHQAERPFRSRLNNALWDEFRHDGLPEVNHAADAMSMAFSLEARAPFLDHRLVDFCFSLPFSEKVSGGWTKSLLRRALRDVIPAEVLARRRKLGLSSPFGRWLKLDNNWRDVRDLLLDPRCRERGIFDPKRLERSLEAFYGNPDSNSSAGSGRVWRWITLELWFRDFVDGKLDEPSPEK